MNPNDKFDSKSGANICPRVYLAGPEVFLPNAKELGKRKKEICAKYGFKGIFPIDVEINEKEFTNRAIGLRISEENERLIRSCQLLIANITPFRGPSADVGTAYEIGLARGIGLMVCAYSNVKTLFAERTLNWLYKSRFNDINYNNNKVWLDSNGMVVEKWGLVDNLMIDGGIHASGGILVTQDAPNEELFTYLEGFEKCLQYAQSVIFNLRK